MLDKGERPIRERSPVLFKGYGEAVNAVGFDPTIPWFESKYPYHL